ncbi:hypothetical protein CFC21_107044 [Triticum aestivum]|uniref:Uncharacterized protein n=1 Tax=Triticum aestivum TaxID=4565 RepID=A0A9R1MF94_WHEAT|nr:hypothetical protein CFC21_107044 [Triticum aestivum]
MDKILAFSIMSSSLADMAVAGYATRLSWRSRSWQQPEKATEKQRQEEKVDQVSPTEIKREFDGINCFESMISF